MTAGVFSKERTVIFYKLRLVFVKKQDLSSVLCQVKCWQKVTTCTWSNHRMIGVIDGKINIINKSVLIMILYMFIACLNPVGPAVLAD